MGKNSSKTEQKGISILRNLLDKMDTVTYSLEEGDKNISWDGDIKLYKNADIDDKSNLSSIIRVQVKSRTKKISRTAPLKAPLCFCALRFNHRRFLAPKQGKTVTE